MKNFECRERCSLQTHKHIYKCKHFSKKNDLHFQVCHFRDKEMKGTTVVQKQNDDEYGCYVLWMNFVLLVVVVAVIHIFFLWQNILLLLFKQKRSWMNEWMGIIGDILWPPSLPSFFQAIEEYLRILYRIHFFIWKSFFSFLSFGLFIRLIMSMCVFFKEKKSERIFLHREYTVFTHKNRMFE